MAKHASQKIIVCANGKELKIFFVVELVKGIFLYFKFTPEKKVGHFFKLYCSQQVQHFSSLETKSIICFKSLH